MNVNTSVVSEERIDDFTVLQTYSDGSFLAIDRPINEYVVPNHTTKKLRAASYANESDPLFFKAQRGEATIEEWEAKVAEIRDRYPYPELDGQVWDDTTNEWKPEQTDTINVNTADFETLRTLHGVDEVRAQAIIDGRPWEDTNDLTSVQGISQEMVDSWDIMV